MDHSFPLLYLKYRLLLFDNLHCFLSQQGDLTDSKVKMIEENVARCGFNNITVERQDATAYVNKDDEKADIVIADVPCSGMGVLRKIVVREIIVDPISLHFEPFGIE